MRTLSSTSRALLAAAVVVAGALVLGGAYFVGYVGEVHRDLSDPASSRRQAAAEIAAIEKTLGYGGFLKAYRNYRLIGNAKERAKLTQSVAKAARALAALRKVTAANPSAKDALIEAGAVVDTFAHIARVAPQLGDAALRGTPAMDALNALPQSPQLEATYLSLVGALERLRHAAHEEQLGGAASALNASQVLIIAALVLLVMGLLVAAGLLQLGIIQPLKSLEHSLASIGDGAIAHRIWGADRKDEFGQLARAGEKLRRSLAETAALKVMVDKGKLHLTLDGKSSVVFDKLAADVASAADALKAATADLTRLNDQSRRQCEATASTLGQSAAAFANAAKTAGDQAAAAIGELHASAARLDEAASRLGRLDDFAQQIDQAGRALDRAASGIKEKTDAVADGLSASNASLERIVGEARLLQTALSSACDRSSSEAIGAGNKVQTLAARLADIVGSLDTRLAGKLGALDQLEQGLGQVLARLQRSASDLAAQPGTMPAHNSGLAEILRQQCEAIRGEIRDLTVRMAEDRLLAAADMPLLGGNVDARTEKAVRTLADVPGEEIMARLRSLASEMSAAQSRLDHTASLKDALGRFATELKNLADGAGGSNMGDMLDRHADEITAHVEALDPAAAERRELGAIAGELREVAARARSDGGNDPSLRDAAARLAARAQSLFDLFDNAVAEDDNAPPPGVAMDATQADLAALAALIARLESCVEQQARTALADRFAEISDTMSPAERPNGARDAQSGNDAAIRTVFESIERLNNVAAALARAGDIERQRRVAH